MNEHVMPKKIEVCCGSKCSTKNSEEIFEHLQHDFADTDTQIRFCGCLGRCAKGPNILVDDKKILHYTKVRNVTQRILDNEGLEHYHYDEDSLDFQEDFLGDL